jgi:hypothetical protein
MWTPEQVEALNRAVLLRYNSMRVSKKTDRRNFSEIWNRHLCTHGGVVLKGLDENSPNNALRFLLNMINYENDTVSDALVIRNPDRPGQYILLPRDVASRILLLGMI